MVQCLTIMAGMVCTLWALQQLRMTLIYMNILHAPIIGEFAGPQPALIRVALLDVLKYGAFALVFFAVHWPGCVTYLLAVLLLKSLLEFFLAVFLGSALLTAKGRAYAAALQLIPCAFYIVALAVSSHFLGW